MDGFHEVQTLLQTIDLVDDLLDCRHFLVAQQLAEPAIVTTQGVQGLDPLSLLQGSQQFRSQGHASKHTGRFLG